MSAMAISNHQPHDCLLNLFIQAQIIETSKLRATGLCAGNSPLTGEFPTQKASYADNFSIWWRHHATRQAEKHLLSSYILDGFNSLQLGL